MKRLAVFSMLAFLFWSAVPAGANSVPSIDIACDRVTVGWSSFPTRPVELVITLEQHARTYERVVSTDGLRDGETVIPANFADGPATATVEWTLAKVHHAGPVETVLHCTPATTEPPTTSTSSTVPSSLPGASTTVTPTTTPGLPDTGSGASLWALGAGAYAVVLGAVFMALNRRPTR